MSVTILRLFFYTVERTELSDGVKGTDLGISGRGEPETYIVIPGVYPRRMLELLYANSIYI